MNPTLRRIFDIAVMLMWMVVGIIVPLNLSPELRAQIWVAIAIHLTLAAILWFVWWAEGKRTRSRAFDFATLWFVPVVSMNIDREPFWPWAQPLWPWVAIIAGLGCVACICLSAQASAAEDKAAGKEPGPPVSKLRLALAFVCMIVWGLAVCYQGWPESLTQQHWAKLAINVIAVGSVWLFWVLNPERPRTWPKLGYYVFFSFVTVTMLGAGISPWAWRNDTLELALMAVTAVFGLTLYLKNWRASRAG